jgi:ribonuclease-3
LKKKRRGWLDEFLWTSEKNRSIYRQALIHKSANKEFNNERLEFLGDSVLSIIVSEYLYSRDLKEGEGVLSKKRDLIISRKTLNKIAEGLFDKKSLSYSSKEVSENMYGNYLEALIGAIYLDQGIEAAKGFVEQKIISQIALETENKEDFKSKLIEWADQHKKKINFVLLETSGPDHNKRHKVGLMLGEKTIDTCWASTIKKGEQALSKKACITLI